MKKGLLALLSLSMLLALPACKETGKQEMKEKKGKKEETKEKGTKEKHKKEKAPKEKHKKEKGMKKEKKGKTAQEEATGPMGMKKLKY